MPAQPSPLRPAELTAVQRVLYDALASGPRADRSPFVLVQADGSLTGPFDLMLRAPGVGSALSQLGEAIRFGGTLSDRHRELAILTVAAVRKSDYEWYAHERVARGLGWPRDDLSAVARGDIPYFRDASDAVVVAFSRAALAAPSPRARDGSAASGSTSSAQPRARGPSPDGGGAARGRASRDKAVEALGEEAVVELTVLLGYYTTLALLLEAFDVGVPDGETGPDWAAWQGTG